MRRNRVALLIALGVDNLGSGSFLPVTLLYVIRVVGLPVAVAGTVVAAGTVAGLGVPAVAGRLTDRVGPLRVVVGAEVLQALGAAGYLAARGAASVAVAAVLLGAGQQLFYSSLFALIADVAGDGPKDRPFAVAAMVRSVCFSAGGLITGGLLTLAGPASYRIAVVADAASFAVCALLLALLVRVPRPAHRDPAPRPGRDPGGRGTGAGTDVASEVRAAVSARRRGPLSDRPFLVLIAAACLASLAGDFFLAGMSVYVLGELHSRPWLPGAAVAVAAGLTGAGGTVALRLTRRLRRTTAIALAAWLYVVFCGGCLAALAVPPGWRPAELLAATVVLALAGLLFQRANALAEAVAPAAVRGRYLAAFQYAFTVAGVVAPAVVALYSVAVWLPWLLVAACAALSAVLIRWLAPRLPATRDPVPVPADSAGR
ncbi:MAG TPA: MFS transporter [Streptosporangiaceae bacterium]|nr:MFS transporter [Streptosporangiaceae bacterium]